MRECAKEAAEKQCAHRMIQRLEGLDDNLEKAARGRTKFDRLTGTGQIRYGPNLVPIPAGVGESCKTINLNQSKEHTGYQIKWYFVAAKSRCGTLRGCKVLKKVLLCQGEEANGK